MPDAPFYDDGLRFQCTRCSRCCRHTPGYVFVSENDIARLSRFLGLARGEIIRRYCRQVSFGIVKRISFTEKQNLDCVFWENDGCSVYEARPLQCQSFPFWSSNVASRAEWEGWISQCPGIGQGRIHSKGEIERWLRRRVEEGFIER
jgi:Fe-S-cluster containining protein